MADSGIRFRHSAASYRPRLARRALSRDRRKRAHHGAANLGAGAYRAAASGGDHGHGTGMGGGFAVAFGGESVTVRMVIGGLAIVSAMYLVEQPERRLLKSREHVA